MAEWEGAHEVRLEMAGGSLGSGRHMVGDFRGGDGVVCGA